MLDCVYTQNAKTGQAHSVRLFPDRLEYVTSARMFGSDSILGVSLRGA